MMDKENRYLRQIELPEIGADGQLRLQQAHVLVAGCGALGSNGAEAIVRTGVGKVTLVDSDTLELGNLQRQALLTEGDVGKPKAQALAQALAQVNSEIDVQYEVARVSATNIERLVSRVDLVLDGFDNLPARYLLNDACVKHGVAWVFAAVAGTFGMMMPIIPGKTACLRCLSPDPAPDRFVLTAGNAGLVNTIPRAIVANQVTNALRILIGAVEPPTELVTYDIWHGQFNSIPIERNPACPACARKEFAFLNQGSPG